jgi:hypothetical protein
VADHAQAERAIALFVRGLKDLQAGVANATPAQRASRQANLDAYRARGWQQYLTCTVGRNRYSAN